MPDNLLIASAAVVSGKSPKASESTIETILSLSLCLSIAAIKLALVPTTITSSTRAFSWEISVKGAKKRNKNFFIGSPKI